MPAETPSKADSGLFDTVSSVENWLSPLTFSLYTSGMRYTWTSVAIIVIWISASILIVRGNLPNPETFFLYLMGVTVILAAIGFRSA